jgi:hypothetical protein
VSKPPATISGIFNYRFSGWLVAAVVVVLILCVKYLMT